MKYILQLLTLFTILLIPLSCENMDSIFVNCDECFSELPAHADISIIVTNNEENTDVPITIFEGSIDDGNIIYESINQTFFYAKVGKYYSVIAEYRKNGKIIYAVDGKKLRAKKDESSCTEPCYVIVGDEFDVRLK